MPLLLSDSLVIITKFLQILLWISIPALFVGMLITTVIHYSNKRKKAKKKEEQPFMFEEEGSCSGYDDISLVPSGFYSAGSKQEIKRLMQHLSHSNAKYIAMKKDFTALNEKYQKLQQVNYNGPETIKIKTMETIHTGFQQTPGEQVNNIMQLNESDKKELISELSQLNKAYEDLEKTNSNLQEQLNACSNDETKVTEIIQKWEEEKIELKKQISEHEYLKDVVEEKKLQINFLQQQLEQRIKNHRLVEQQFRELGIKLMEATEQLEIKQQSTQEFQATLLDKEQEINFLKVVLETSTANAGQMEVTIKEMEDRHSSLSVEVSEKNSLISNLQAQLLVTSEAKVRLEEKLEKNQSLFKGLHRNLSDILEEEVSASPVIAMKPVYKQENTDEQVTESAVQ